MNLRGWGCKNVRLPTSAHEPGGMRMQGARLYR